MFLSADAAALFAAEAFVADAAVPQTTLRHLRIHASPFVLVPMSLAGEDGAPLAFGWGRGDAMERWVVPEPRDRDEVWLAFEAVASALCEWLDPIAAEQTERGRRSMTLDPAQLVVPTAGAVTLLRKMAERMVRAPGSVDRVVRRAGGWLHFFLDRHEVAVWDSALLVATDALSMHWALPLSPAECNHLIAAMAALESLGSARSAARAVEHQPGGTLTMPEFDAAHLEPAVTAYGNAAPAEKALRREAIDRLLEPVIANLYATTCRALERLRALPPIPAVLTQRAEEEQAALARHADYLERRGFFARADSLSRSVLLVDDAEKGLARAKESARRADPVLRAIAASTGEALDGVIVSTDTPKVPVGRQRRMRVRLGVRVPGPWRGTRRASYAVIWEREKTATFEVLETKADGNEETLVLLQSLAQHKLAEEALSKELRVGKRVAFVKEESSFESFGFPSKLPWMLRRDDAE